MTQFVLQRTVSVKPEDPLWLNNYNRLLLRKKNRNYKLFKKASTNLTNSQSNTNTTQEYITMLKNRKNKAEKNRDLLLTSPLRQNCFYNSINSTLNRPDLSAKKKFSILLKLMKNHKFSSTPSFIENVKTVSNEQEKSNILNYFFWLQRHQSQIQIAVFLIYTENQKCLLLTV